MWIRECEIYDGNCREHCMSWNYIKKQQLKIVCQKGRVESIVRGNFVVENKNK